MHQFQDHLITDRTAADVNRVRYLNSLWDSSRRRWRGTPQEWVEWQSEPQGAYSAKDLNRVTLAASYLLTKLGELGYKIPEDTFPAYLASAFVDPPGSGTVQGALFYKGDPATVSAAPIGESRFLYWSKNGETVSEDPIYTFTADADVNLTAHFEAEWVMQSSIVGAGRIGKAILGKGL